MTFIFFNLLVNSILSLAIGLILVYFFIWFFRVETGRWKIFLLSLPFLKIVFDFARGVPEKSVLYSGVDPFSLPPKHQLLTVGAGFDGWTPHFSAVFSVNALDGKIYHSSIGDYLLIWLHRTYGSGLPFFIVSVVLLISLLLLVVRSFQYFRFERVRRKDRASLNSFRSVSVGRRSVDIYISPFFKGTPFTGGFIMPYICFPEDAAKALRREEFEAVVAHELGHVRHYDLMVTVLIQSLGDLFWFVPGYRWLSRKIDRLREVVADNWAVSNGAEPQFLAAALLKLKETTQNEKKLALYSAFFREKSLLKERVERLLGQVKDKTPRFGWQFRSLRYVAVLFIAVAVLNSVFGGNFEQNVVMRPPAWLQKILDSTAF